ncbi:Cell pole-organizing protein PopZ [Pannonibacter indicus]|uniref:Cell pole-organizing protein PopZ n=3 Tax=Pannonibacter indicus TaxID=466044 RepID=A0A0K6I9Q2_9HYPH|nr:Cell pole-organizing protein PopZ [Pannonibacter indicus]
MEEILASIRRIISDEEAPAAKKTAPAAPELVAEMTQVNELPEEEEAGMSQDDLDKLFDMAGDDDDGDAAIDDDIAAFEADEDVADDDVLELTEELAVGEEEDPFAMVEGMPDTMDDDTGDIGFMEEKGEPAPAPKAAPQPARSSVAEGLVPVSMDNLDPLDEEAPLISDMAGAAVSAAFENLSSTILSANARTLEDLVREMLRPMLKSWLDQNLPVMVERLVRQEIERVVRKR